MPKWPSDHLRKGERLVPYKQTRYSTRRSYLHRETRHLSSQNKM